MRYGERLTRRIGWGETGPVRDVEVNHEDELSTSQSWTLLRHGEVGRLAVAVDGHPDIFPVNYAVGQESVVFRSAAGTKLAACAGHQVAFEAEGHDDLTSIAWSVVVRGRAVRVDKLYDVLEMVELPLFPWHSGPKPHFIRIDVDTISGRRLVVTGNARADTGHGEVRAPPSNVKDSV